MKQLNARMRNSLFWGCLFALLLSSPAAMAQSRPVTGTVTDGTGEPVAGAFVVVAGTSNGTMTDAEGKYTLSVVPEASLSFSFYGMNTQEVAVGAQTVIDVMMSADARQLDDVIAVGYGTQRVRDLTGSATAISMSEIPDVPGASLVDMLDGQVVGLSVDASNGRPGETGSFKIRQPVQFAIEGQPENAAYNQPLIVIDGVVQIDYQGQPTMETFNMLDRSEIANMTILKDASAAVYGSRASSGVILVETKRGTVGKAKISYSGRLDYADAISHRKYMNAYDLGVFTNRMFEQNQTNVYAPNTSNDMRANNFTEDDLERMKKLDYDWLDEAWKPAVSQRHSLSIDGGSETATFFAGIAYQDQGNNLGNTQEYDKWTFRAGGNVKVAAGLNLSASLSGYTDTQMKSKVQVGEDYSTLITMPKWIPWEYEVDGKMQYVSPWPGPQDSDHSTDINVKKGRAVQNYFANEASGARTMSYSNGWNANFSLRYDVPFVKGLSLSGSYSISRSNSRSEELGAAYSLIRPTNIRTDLSALPGSHLIGENTVWDVIRYGHDANTDNRPLVLFNKTNGESNQVNAQINYARTFGLHDVSATAVVERAETFGTIMKLQYDDVQPSYNGSSNTLGVPNTGGTSFVPHESGALGYIGRFGYKYDDRYLFNLVGRSDASTKFAPENYWGTFLTGSVGWVISEEEFFKDSKLSDIFQFLKLRYSLGKTGKDNIAPWLWTTKYTVGSTSGLGFGPEGGQAYNGAQLDGTPNRAVRWDETVKQNIGLDLNVLSNRLSITTDFYYDKTTDLLLNIVYPEEPIYIGSPIPMANAGKKDAWGWEFSARWSDRIETGTSWGPIRYGIGMDYGISWNKTISGYSNIWDYPSVMDSKGNMTGWRSPGSEWGFKTWKNTSSGDGMLRTQADIDAYWAYLSEHAAAAGVNPSYFGKTTKEQMQLGMIAYQDLGGYKDTQTQTLAGPDGRIDNSVDAAADFAKLASKRSHSISTRLNASWGNFSWSTQLNTSWGGYTGTTRDFSQGVGRSTAINSQLILFNDMFDPVKNPDGKFPSMVAGNVGEYSDFWQLPTFRMYVRNMSFSYSLPKKLLDKINVDRVQLSLTGNNLWDFYNPYPMKYRNMYDDGDSVAYPTLRTWTFGLNVTF